MNITKRDIADIVFATFGIVFFMAFLQGLMAFTFYLGMNEEAAVYTDKTIGIIFTTLHVTILGSVSFFLLFRRGAVLNIVFQKDDTRTLSIPDGVSSITQYAFWIRLIGVFMFLKAATEFLGLLTITLASKDDFSSFSYNGRSTWQSLIITLLSLLIVVKADFIASRLNVKKDE